MDTTIVFALFGVATAWSIVFLIVRHWGPGIVRRSLLCPEKQAPARVTFQRSEGSFGSLKAAVEAGALTSGIMHACITHNIDTVLAGSIRDDGPLPEVITDTLVAQEEMRKRVPDVGLALMIATGLHAIATGNLLPAAVPVVCVDIQASVVTKLGDRGSFQTVGLVTDVEPFLRELLTELE